MNQEDEERQRPTPDGRQKDAMDRAMKRYDARSEPLAFADQPEGTNKLDISGKHSDQAGHVLHLLDTFGTASAEFAQNSVGRVAAVMRQRGKALPDDTELNAGLAAVSGIAPENEIEAMLAVQMVGTHEVAMEMLTKAKRAETTDHLERYGTLATKLLRTYTAQLEALSKLRRGGAQKVTVEHVHVYEGGQAIVGNVTTAGAQTRQGGGGRQETGHQAHELTGPAALALQADPSMLCPDAGRDCVPVASGAGEDAMPQARRRQGKRRAQG
ncbi:hypothetical protein MKK88_09590 [Methylobacterium sp. E-005]|uniref:hypothetical protein n=1 Tax=Methylobacterium sp. E-005 TaxID=2836549 RepID=UPI001FBA0261|nr:hypothetical protein [Methylobacterium sp. E-005]MCJ2086246.1 hypothetical protein [Methylobacterium sp. E-005]